MRTSRSGPAGFQIIFGLSFTLGPLTFTANGGAGVYSNGIALDLQVSLNADAEVFSITASGTLQINTTTQTELGIAPGSFYLAVSGSVDILKVFDFNASMTIYVGPDPNTGAEGYWSFNANANISFFGLATLSGTIFLDSDGNFQISLNGQIVLGSSDFGLVGQFSIFVESTGAEARRGVLHVRAQRQREREPQRVRDLAGRPRRRLRLQGAGLGLGPDHAQLRRQHPLPVLDDPQDRVSFTIGYLQLPTTVFLAGAAASCPRRGQLGHLPAAELERNGRQPAAAVPERRQPAQYRNIGGDGTQDSYEIKQVGGTSGDATIQVNAFGRQETYQHVSSIVGDWSSQSCSASDPCSETVQVDPSVTVPVHITGATGEFSDNTIEYEGQQQRDDADRRQREQRHRRLGPVERHDRRQPRRPAGLQRRRHHQAHGTGTATITSGAGNWFIVGGTSSDQITVGNGNNQIAGPAGTITLGDGSNVVYLTAGQGSTTIDGGGNGATNTLIVIAAPGDDTLSGATAPNSVSISVAGGGSTGTYTGRQRRRPAPRVPGQHRDRHVHRLQRRHRLLDVPGRAGRDHDHELDVLKRRRRHERPDRVVHVDERLREPHDQRGRGADADGLLARRRRHRRRSAPAPA